MRTTIRLDDDLYRRAKAEAARSGRPVSEVIEDAVRAALTPRVPEAAALAPLPTHGGSGVRPGVDLTDAGELRAVMDEGEPLDALR